MNEEHWEHSEVLFGTVLKMYLNLGLTLFHSGSVRLTKATEQGTRIADRTCTLA